MIHLPRAVRIFIHREPVDMRKSFDTLAGIVRLAYGEDLLHGGVFAFVGKRRKHAKVIWWDGTGVVLLSKRLSKGHFAAPWQRPGSGPLRWTTSELALFLEGSELVGRVELSPPPWRPEEQRLEFR